LQQRDAAIDQSSRRAALILLDGELLFLAGVGCARNWIAPIVRAEAQTLVAPASRPASVAAGRVARRAP
jgi:hypothetical protein